MNLRTTLVATAVVAMTVFGCGKHPKPAATVTNTCNVQGPAYIVPAPGRIVPATAASGAP